MKRVKKWLKEIAIFLVLFFIMILVMDYWNKPKIDFTPQQDEMVLMDSNNTVSLTQLSEDQPLLIYFWATWCGICKLTTPTVLDMAQQGENVISVVIRSGSDDQLIKTVGNGLKELPIVNDQYGQISSKWDVNATPTFIILYKGKIAYSTTGWSSKIGLKIRMALAKWGE